MKFSEILEIRNGKNQRKVENPSGAYPIYGSGGVMGRADEYICPADTVVIGRKGTINNPIYVDTPFWNVDTAFGLIPDTKIILPKYLYYFCRSFDFETLNTTVTIPSLTKTNLLQIEVDVPPMEKQRTVIATLDAIQNILLLIQKQTECFDQLVKSRFIEMFGDPVTNPMGWEEHQLDDYITFLTSGSRGWSKYFSDDGEIFITIKNVKNNRISLDNVQYITPPDNAEAQRTKVREGDLLISITADLGRTGVVSKDIEERGAYINQHLTCIRLKQDKVNPGYVSYFMESDAGKRQFEAKNQAAVKAGLNFDAIKSLKLLVPPLKLQNEYMSFVELTDKSKLVLRWLLEKQELLRAKMMQEYFG